MLIHEFSKHTSFQNSQTTNQFPTLLSLSKIKTWGIVSHLSSQKRGTESFKQNMKSTICIYHAHTSKQFRQTLLDQLKDILKSDNFEGEPRNGDFAVIGLFPSNKMSTIKPGKILRLNEHNLCLKSTIIRQYLVGSNLANSDEGRVKRF